MPKRCTDPRCPLNKTINKFQKEYCKIHGRPYVSFAFDDTEKYHRERDRGRKNSRSNKLRDHSNSKCYQNKKCQTVKCTIERSTSTSSRPTARSHASGKSGMHFHRHKDKGRPCECRYKRCCKREEETVSDKKKRRNAKGIRRYRSRRRKRKCSTWLRNCFRRLCICAKTPSSIDSCECCCTYQNKYEEISKKSKKSKKNIFPSNKQTWREDNHLIHKCRCMDSFVENHLIPQNQSYLQSIFSRGLNVMRKGINLCM